MVSLSALTPTVCLCMCHVILRVRAWWVHMADGTTFGSYSMCLGWHAQYQHHRPALVHVCLVVILSGRGAVYTYDAIGSYERTGYSCQGSGKDLIQPVLDNQLKADSPLLVPPRVRH